jgi:hypothetical protein
VLTLPLIAAAATAGLIGGMHCAGMCGGIAGMLGKPERRYAKTIPIHPAKAAGRGRTALHVFLLHSGRLLSYALMGAVVGALGGAGLLLKPIAPVHALLFVFGNVALIWLGLRIVDFTPRLALLDTVGGWIAAHMRVPRSHPLLTGMAWGCLPCGLLYGVLPFALLSGEAWSGAALMMIFGLGALPYLLFAQWAAEQRNNTHLPVALRAACAAALIGLGIFGLAHLGSPALPGIFCITPQA